MLRLFKATLLYRQVTALPCFLLVISCMINEIDAFFLQNLKQSPCQISQCIAFSTMNDHDTNFIQRQIDRTDNELQKVPVLDDISCNIKPLIESIINATVLRNSNTINQGHDSFRYEWGTWVNDDNLRYCMDRIDEIRLVQGAYDWLLKSHVEDSNAGNTGEKKPLRLRVGSGQDWDCLLHVLPEQTSWQGRWPGGSWAIVKSLTGMARITALRGPNRDGKWVDKTSRQLRGGSDGSLGSGQTTAGEACIKYVGGPVRRYTGMYGKTVLLEVVVRPPIGTDESQETAKIPPLVDIDNILSVFKEEEVIETNSLNNHVEQPSYIDSEANHVGLNMGLTFDKVGGLDRQLNAIARRVLASRRNPKAARRLGVSHVRGILLSGPPGCGKTLLARELARLLGAREPQIVNGPEILDKYIGEAEKKVRELFVPAEQEYRISGDDSALHIIIFDEMDAIARKRGTMTSDTTGVRDSVVNQLLAKMDGVKQLSNVLVVGLTNRPELLDPALLRPGRLEVQLRIELPDLLGRRDILRIHTRQMKEAGALSQPAIDFLEDTSDKGVASRTDYFSGAELAGLVRSAASFALSRFTESQNDNENSMVTVADLEMALKEVHPALGKQDEVLKIRYPLGISMYSNSIKRIQRDLSRFLSPVVSDSPRIQSLLLVGGGGSGGGAGVTALSAHAAHEASISGSVDFVRFITALDLLNAAPGDGVGEERRAAALVELFTEAKDMSTSVLVLDDIDQLCAGSGPNGYSSVMLSTLRALLRSPPSFSSSVTQAGGQSGDNNNNNGNIRNKKSGKIFRILAATSRSDSACTVLNTLFDETIVVPLIQDKESLQTLIQDSFPNKSFGANTISTMAAMIIDRLGEVSCKTALRLVERAMIAEVENPNSTTSNPISALHEILKDLSSDAAMSESLCAT